MHLVEQKFQGWHAVAIQANGSEHLLCLGHSYEQVKKHYASCFYDLLTENEQINVIKINIDRWTGVADSGKWLRQDSAKVPVVTRKIAV